MFYIGIDGGGTKSRLVGVDENLNVLGRNEGDSTNIASNTVETVTGNIKKLLDGFIENNGLDYKDCLSICIGSAGIDASENVSCMKNIFKMIGVKCPVFVVNDAELILWAEMKNDPGIVVISGTGSVAYGKNIYGDTGRCGGWGHIMDDDGSGYWIGKESVRRAFLAEDRRGPQTNLVGLLKDHFKVGELEDIIPIIYSEDFNKQHVSSLAILAERGMLLEDEVCTDILKEAANGLLRMVDALFGMLGLKKDYSRLILSGGNITNNKFMQETLINAVKDKYPYVSVGLAQQEPVMGAVYLAARKMKGDN